MALTTSRTGGLVGPRAFVRTYDHPSYPDPWDAVEDYRRVRAFQAEHPDMGSAAAATRLNLPRARIRRWMEGSRPDCVRGLETADAHGWIDVDPDSPTGRGLNALLAWTLSGGSISTDWFVPRWTLRDRPEKALLDRAADLAGTELDFTRGREQGRAMELKPVEDAAVLGRVLYGMGAPQGTKNTAAPKRLPAYLADASTRLRREFVQVYLHNRGHRRERSELVVFREVRSQGYLEAVAELIESLTGGPVRVNGRNVVCSAQAVAAIDDWPELLGDG